MVAALDGLDSIGANMSVSFLKLTESKLGLGGRQVRISKVGPTVLV